MKPAHKFINKKWLTFMFTSNWFCSKTAPAGIWTIRFENFGWEKVTPWAVTLKLQEVSRQIVAKVPPWSILALAAGKGEVPPWPWTELPKSTKNKRSLDSQIMLLHSQGQLPVPVLVSALNCSLRNTSLNISYWEHIFLVHLFRKQLAPDCEICNFGRF